MSTAQMFVLVLIIVFLAAIAFFLGVRWWEDRKLRAKRYDPKAAAKKHEAIDKEKKGKHEDITKEYEKEFADWRKEFDINSRRNDGDK